MEPDQPIPFKDWLHMMGRELPEELQGHEDCKLRIKDCAICTAKHHLYFEAVQETDERARKVLGPEFI